ncbi:conserved hypothetical protein [Leishmania infantum JPCM5]|uniref:Uncharacterized protein n=2 Tax=Leishmania infantum TaxID=5671 RepID=A4HRX4_LEIIN|nr:conserved hypothetical protein [Leishmania infantum JPCM5]CAC9439907.1 hypothetical_protein_-_conserved [Leishmania infantum]CAM60037.2 conserved hypothetical protein [Leishmania infantum JPCM5]SUZ38784.1 hypothetical_protein_-_conserved [Leishmania infantum]|eukprot:XP_001462816.2 conserved hypothetical protein [Leishmania infantum JPCM5]
MSSRMYARLSQRPSSSASSSLVRRVWHVPLGAVRITDGAEAAAVVTRTASSAPILTPARACTHVGALTISGVILAASAKKTRRQVVSAADDGVPAATAKKPKKQRATRQQAAAPLPASAPVERAVHLSDAVQEWATLRRRCQRQRRHLVAGGASSPSANVAASERSTMAGNAVGASREGNTASTGGGGGGAPPAEISVAERTQLLSVLANEPSAYPQLYTMFYPRGHANVDGDLRGSLASPTAVGKTRWRVEGTPALVRSEAVAMELFTLLHVHHQVVCHLDDVAELNEAAWSSYLSALQARLEADMGQPVRQQCASVALVLRTLMDVHRGQMDRRTTIALSQRLSREQQVQSREEIALRRRVLEALTRLMAPAHALVRQLEEAARSETGKSSLPSSVESTYGDATTLLLMAAVSAVAVEAASALSHSKPVAASVGVSPIDAVLVDEWTTWRDNARSRLASHLQALEASVHKSGLDVVAAVFVDILRCMRWIEELGVVLLPAMGSAVEEACQRILLQACRCAETVKGADLFEYICTPAVTAELRRLSPERTSYAQIITDVCTVAVAYLRQRPQRVPQLMEHLEKEHIDALAKAGAPRAPPARPPLHSPLTELLYAMLCAGFPPESLLTSSLCVSLPPRDVIDVVRAVNRFSALCATTPLPVRTRAVLVDQVAGMLAQCNKDSYRVVVSSTDELGEEDVAAQEEAGVIAAAAAGKGGGHKGAAASTFNLMQRMAAGAAGAAALPGASVVLSSTAMLSSQSQAVAAARKRRVRNSSKRGKRRTASDATEGDGMAAAASAILTPALYRRQVNHLLFVGLEALVECLLRGDAAAVEMLTQAVLPLLQREGREAALADALEVVWEAFRSRLAEMGCDDVSDLTSGSLRSPASAAAAAGRSGRSPALPVALSEDVEKALALLPALFLPRLTESAVKLLGSGLERAGSGSGAGTSKATGFLSHGTVGCHHHSFTAAAVPMSVEELTEVALRLSTAAILCGMPADTVAQLTALHSTLNKSHGKAAGDGGQGDAAGAVAWAFAVVERLERLLSQLSRQSHGLTRHPHSAHARNSGLAVYQLLTIYIASTAAVANSMTQSSKSSAASASTTRQRYRHYLLTVVHLLYRLRTEYTVVVEPAALRMFRIDVFDPALTAVMCAASRGADATPALQMPLTTLTEVMVVTCVADSVQHVSPALVRGVVAAVEQHLKVRATDLQTPEEVPRAESTANTADVVDTATGALATQLLCAAATLCLRADDALTSMLLQLLDLLSPLLATSQAMTVLQRLHATGAPLPALPVRRLIERLVVALRQDLHAATESGGGAATATRRATTVAQRITILHTLSAVQRTAEAAVDDGDAATLLQLLRTVPYGPLLQSFLKPQELAQRRYTVGECGALVEVVAHLTAGEAGTAKGSGSQRSQTGGVDVAATEAKAVALDEARQSQQSTPREAKAEPTASATARWTASEAEAMRLLPRTLAVYVLQAVQLPYNVHDIPLLLRGYAALSGESQLQQQVLRGFVSRTMRAAPTLTPDEIVLCVEAYCAGGVYHQQLYGVLLGRVADMGRKFSLELSVRLLRCGTQAGNASVRTVCVTAVQPIFSAQVRGLLQNDPHMLVSVASTALAILHCLRDCFPHDDIGAAVLANVARYHHDASLPVVKAALELAERRGSTDYDVVHILARHCTERVLPACSPAELANVSYLLIACGLRTAAVMEATYRRLSEVVHTMQAHSLTRLAQGLLRASVEVDTTVMENVCKRIVELAEESAMEATGDAAAAAPLTTQQVCVLLQLLRSVAGRVMTTVMTTVDALLSYVQRVVLQERRDGEPLHGDQPSSYQPPRLLAGMTLREVEAVLRCCIDLSSMPKRFQRLTYSLADYTAYVMAQDASSLAASGGGSEGRLPNSTADRLLNDALVSTSSASTRSIGAASLSATPAWPTDLILLVDLSSLFIRLGEAAHPVVQQLFERQYDRRGVLLQRALLVKTTKQSLEAAGRDVHPALYKLVVDGELL